MTQELALTILPFVAILAARKWSYWKQQAKHLEQMLEESEITYKKAIEIALKKEE